MDSTSFPSLDLNAFPLLACFPTWDIFQAFKKDPHSSKIIGKLAQFASDRKLIAPARRKKSGIRPAFEEFLKNQGGYVNNLPKAHKEYSFAELLDRVLLAHHTTDQDFLEQVNETAVRFAIPLLKRTTLSRLRKGQLNFKSFSQKRILHLLALWLGFNHPDWCWDFLDLLSLQQTSSNLEPKPEGVRLAFFLRPRYDISDLEHVSWLESEIKKSLKWLKIRDFHRPASFDHAVILYDFPKLDGSAGDIYLYSQAILDAFSLGHQVIIRWALGKFASLIHLTIGIDAGVFDGLNQSLEALLKGDMPGVVRITDHAFFLAKLSDVKVVFNDSPIVMKSNRGVPFNTYWVMYFWSHIYFENCEPLLTEEYIPHTQVGYEDLKMKLFHLDGGSRSDQNQKALMALEKYQQSSLLATEIAKMLFFRRYFHEAEKVLNTVISSDPFNLPARILRMSIFVNLAMAQSGDDLHRIFIERALEERLLIQQFCVLDETSCIDMGFLSLCRVYWLFRKTRKNFRAERDVKVIDENIRELRNLIRETVGFFKKGLALSPVGNRSLFWLAHTTALLVAFDFEDSALIGLFSEENKIVIPPGQDDPYVTAITLICIAKGWLDFSNPNFMDILEKHLDNAIHEYEQAVFFKNYRPNILFSFATVLFDFSPQITGKIFKQTIGLLRQAIEEAREFLAINQGIYSVDNSSVIIQSPGRFIQNTQHLIDYLLETAKEKTGKSLEQLADTDLIPSDHIKLSLFLMDTPVEGNKLFSDVNAFSSPRD